MNENLTPQEKIKKVVEAAKEAIEKLEADVLRLQKRGTRELQFPPPGISGNHGTQMQTQIQRLKEKIDNEKTKALTEVENHASKLPPDEQKAARQNAEKVLYPEPKQPDKAAQYGAFNSKFMFQEKSQAEQGKEKTKDKTNQADIFKSTFFRQPGENVKSDKGKEISSSKFINPGKEDR